MKGRCSDCRYRVFDKDVGLYICNLKSKRCAKCTMGQQWKPLRPSQLGYAANSKYFGLNGGTK